MKKIILMMIIFSTAISLFAKSSKKLDEVLIDAADKIVSKAEPGSLVFMGEFKAEGTSSNNGTELENYVAEYLQNLLIESEVLEFVERNQTESIKKERQYQQSGNVRDEDWAEIGAEYGAKYAIYGDGKWKTDTYVITIKMTNVETAKIIVSFRGEVSKYDSDLRKMIGKQQIAKTDKNNKKTSDKNQKFTLVTSGGLFFDKGEIGSSGKEVCEIFSDDYRYKTTVNGYETFVGNLYFNYVFGAGFGVETGGSFYNGGAELVIKSNDELFIAEKYKYMAVDVPICLTFQFKLFHTTVKLLGGANLSVPISCEYIYRMPGSGDKQTLKTTNAVIPGLVFGGDFMIPFGKNLGLDISARYQGDFMPYKIKYKDSELELYKRSGVNCSIGTYLKF